MSVSDRDRIRKALTEKFLAITAERLIKLNNFFMELEEHPNNEALVRDLMREVHTLKGEAKMMGFNAINSVAHRTEDLLLQARAVGFQHSKALGQLILQGFDLVGGMLDTSSSAQHDGLAEDFAARARRLLTELGTAAPNIAPNTAPHAAATPADVTTTLSQLTAAAGVGAAPDAPASPHEPGAGRAGMRMQTRESVRVDMRRIDQLTDATGDLVLGQSRMEQAMRELGELIEQWRREATASRFQISPSQQQRATRSELVQLMMTLTQAVGVQATVFNDFTAVVNRARDQIFESRNRLDDLENRVRELRLVPVSSLFNRFPRAVRDLAAEQHKQVRINIVGAEVSIDSDVLDHIGDPLLHLLRNCVDHGIELPDERRVYGKSTEGVITLEATQKGGQVQISVRDDGRGIDPQRVREAAVQRGVINQIVADSMTDKEIVGLIFRAGFSTRTHVTDVSGRGVGLDAVREQVQLLGGSVDLESAIGRGTTFRLTAPVSMVLGRALVVQIAEGRYAIASESVYIAAEVPDEAFEVVGTGRAFRHNDETIAVSDLATLLDVPTAPWTGNKPHAVLVLEQRGQKRGFIVGKFVGERQMVQRKLDPFFEGLRLINGTAVLEGGDLVLLLNVSELMEGVGEQAFWRLTRGRSESEQPLIMVVDDSEMTRDMIVGILRAGGYRVQEAVDGADALRRLTTERPDLVITDLEMPILDGFGLVRAMREQATLKTLPIIVFSTRGADSDKQQAASLGADAYLVKTNFREEDLLRTVSHFVAQPER